MPFYSTVNAGFTAANTTTFLQISSAAAPGTLDRITAMEYYGEGSASNPTRLRVIRSTAVGTTPTAVTPAQINPRSAAATATSATTFTGQPTLASVALVTPSINVFGALYRYVPPPGQELFIGGAATGDREITLQGTATGTGVVTAEWQFEEL